MARRKRVEKLGKDPLSSAPDKENPCVWMQAKVINFKLCDQFYSCLTCSFDKGMREAFTQSSKTLETKDLQSLANKEDAMSNTQYIEPGVEHSLLQVTVEKGISADEHVFFQQFDPKHVPILLECASRQDFKAGTYLFKENLKATHQYLIVKGRVALELTAPGQPPWLLMTVCDRGIVGFAWAYPPNNYYFSCKALIDTHTIMLEAECLRAKVQSDSELGYRMMTICSQTMADRLRATRIQLLNVLLTT